MRIVKYLNTTREEIDLRKYNIWIGISLGNKYWTSEHVNKFLDWALTHTRERVLVVVGDELHAFNLEVLDYRSPSVALKRALKIGDERYIEISNLISKLSATQQKMVHLVRWKDITNTTLFQRRLRIVREAYFKDAAFRNYILDIVRHGRQDRAGRLALLSEQELDRLAEYILNELPHFVDGVQGYGDGLIYTLIAYPGLTKLDELFVGLQRKTLFPELAEQLDIKNNIAIVEMYAD